MDDRMRRGLRRSIGVVVVTVLAVITGIATIGAVCEVLYGTLWHALLLMTPFFVITTVLSRWSERRRTSLTGVRHDR